MSDPQGLPANISVSAVTSNRPRPGCRCRPSTKDACTCTPDAAVTSSGATTTVRLMPQGLTTTFATQGQVFRVSYTATVPQTGLACTSTAEVCFILNGGTTKAVACAPYTSTGVEVDATRCTST